MSTLIDNRTATRNLPLPHPDNPLEVDVLRIRDTFNQIDAAFAAFTALLTSDDVNLDTVQEIVTVLKNAQGSISSVTSLLATKADKAVTDQLAINKADTSHIQAVDKGGTGKTAFTQYSLLYASATTTLAEIGPNTSTTLKALCMTGTGAAGAVPVWTAITAASIGAADTAHVQAVDKGGTAKTSYTQFSILYASGTAALAEIAPNTTATLKALCMTGTGVVGAVPVWVTITPALIGAAAASDLAAKANKPSYAAAPAWADYSGTPLLTIDLTGASDQKAAITITGDTSIYINAINKTVPAAVTVFIAVTRALAYAEHKLTVVPFPGSGLRPMSGGMLGPVFGIYEASTRILAVTFRSNGQGDVIVSGLPYGTPA